MGEGIDRMSNSGSFYDALSRDYHSTFSVPFFGDRWPAIYLVWFTIIASIFQIAITGLIVWWSGFRFDSLVKRARDPIGLN